MWACTLYFKLGFVKVGHPWNLSSSITSVISAFFYYKNSRLNNICSFIKIVTFSFFFASFNWNEGSVWNVLHVLCYRTVGKSLRGWYRLEPWSKDSKQLVLCLVLTWSPRKYNLPCLISIRPFFVIEVRAFKLFKSRCSLKSFERITRNQPRS